MIVTLTVKMKQVFTESGKQPHTWYFVESKTEVECRFLSMISAACGWGEMCMFLVLLKWAAESHLWKLKQFKEALSINALFA